MLLESVTPAVICKILFVQIVLKVVNKGEQILSLSTECPEGHSISRRLGGDAQEGDFSVHYSSSNYFKNFNPGFMKYHHSPLALNRPFALLGVDGRCL